jgi:ssDNA-binding Zn-finger/Zn-ribbon topoisomerase 1
LEETSCSRREGLFEALFPEGHVNDEPSEAEDISTEDYFPMFPAVVHDLKCGECGGGMEIRVSKDERPFYGCIKYPDCTGTVGAFPDGRPMGIPGDKETRKARIEAHQYFDILWKAPEGKMSRRAAYVWLKEVMGKSDAEARFGLFDIADCQRAVALIKQHYPETQNFWDRLSSGLDI